MPIESDAYPAPRLSRAVASSVPPVGQPAGGISSPPTIHLFSFQLEVSTQNRKSVAVSQRFRGNVVVLDASWFSLAIAAPLPPGLFGIFLSDDDTGARTDSATLTAPTGVALFDPLQYSTPGAAPTQFDGTTLAGAQSTVVHHRAHRLGYYGGPGDKFLKVSLLSSTGAVGQFDVGGWIRVAEGVAESDILGFL